MFERVVRAGESSSYWRSFTICASSSCQVIWIS